MLRDQAPKAKSKSLIRARTLRREMSLPEVRVLRTRPHRMKFRRQHASGAYVLDFFCSDARLAIEIDGQSHELGHRPQRDEARDQWFSEAGIETLRLGAADVLRDYGAAAEPIVAAARARLPLHHPASPGGPPPRDKLGED
jgi:very-short-patch-repair endonuclease